MRSRGVNKVKNFHKDFISITRLGSGSEGLVLLAHNLKTGKFNALKKIECLGLEEVSRVENQIKVLLQLPDHPNLIKHTEYFIQNFKTKSIYQTSKYSKKKDENVADKVDESESSGGMSPKQVEEHISSGGDARISSILMSMTSHKELYFVVVVMEFCNAGTLHQVIRNFNLPGRNFSQKDVVFWITEIAKGLQMLHQNNIIHRDIKPSNIFLCDTGLYPDFAATSNGWLASKHESFICKIGDFGLLKHLHSKLAQTRVGTLQFMSPEILNDVGHDTSSDIWSYGILVLLFLITLNNPKDHYDYHDEILRKMRSKLLSNQGMYNTKTRVHLYNEYMKTTNHKLCIVMFECLSFSPEQRPTADEIIEFLGSSKKFMRVTEKQMKLLTKQYLEDNKEMKSTQIVRKFIPEKYKMPRYFVVNYGVETTKNHLDTLRKFPKARYFWKIYIGSAIFSSTWRTFAGGYQRRYRRLDIRAKRGLHKILCGSEEETVTIYHFALTIALTGFPFSHHICEKFENFAASMCDFEMNLYQDYSAKVRDLNTQFLKTGRKSYIKMITEYDIFVRSYVLDRYVDITMDCVPILPLKRFYGPGQRMMIYGKPLTGKTILLKTLAYLYAKENVDNTEFSSNEKNKPFLKDLVPIYVNVRFLAENKENDEIFFLACCRTYRLFRYTIDIEQYLYECYLKKRVLILFDGINEVIDTRYQNYIFNGIRELAKYFEGSKSGIICTSRVKILNSKLLPVFNDFVELPYLSEKQQEIISKLNGLNSQFKSDVLDKYSDDLCRVPMFLRMTIELFKKKRGFMIGKLDADADKKTSDEDSGDEKKKEDEEEIQDNILRFTEQMIRETARKRNSEHIIHFSLSKEDVISYKNIYSYKTMIFNKLIDRLMDDWLPEFEDAKKGKKDLYTVLTDIADFLLQLRQVEFHSDVIICQAKQKKRRLTTKDHHKEPEDEEDKKEDEYDMLENNSNEKNGPKVRRFIIDPFVYVFFNASLKKKIHIGAFDFITYNEKTEMYKFTYLEYQHYFGAIYLSKKLREECKIYVKEKKTKVFKVLRRHKYLPSIFDMGHSIIDPWFQPTLDHVYLQLKTYEFKIFLKSILRLKIFNDYLSVNMVCIYIIKRHIFREDEKSPSLQNQEEVTPEESIFLKIVNFLRSNYDIKKRLFYGLANENEYVRRISRKLYNNHKRCEQISLPDILSFIKKINPKTPVQYFNADYFGLSLGNILNLKERKETIVFLYKMLKNSLVLAVDKIVYVLKMLKFFRTQELKKAISILIRKYIKKYRKNRTIVFESSIILLNLNGYFKRGEFKIYTTSKELVDTIDLNKLYLIIIKENGDVSNNKYCDAVLMKLKDYYEHILKTIDDKKPLAPVGDINIDENLKELLKKNDINKFFDAIKKEKELFFNGISYLIHLIENDFYINVRKKRDVTKLEIDSIKLKRARILNYCKHLISSNDENIDKLKVYEVLSLLMNDDDYEIILKVLFLRITKLAVHRSTFNELEQLFDVVTNKIIFKKRNLSDISENVLLRYCYPMTLSKYIDVFLHNTGKLRQLAFEHIIQICNTHPYELRKRNTKKGTSYFQNVRYMEAKKRRKLVGVNFALVEKRQIDQLVECQNYNADYILLSMLINFS